MNGVKYELAKLAEEIDQMLINPRKQIAQSIFDINFYSFTHKCLHTTQILLNCIDVDEGIRIAYNKVAKIMKEAAKRRPEQDVSQQELGGKDQITIFLNTRKPIPIQQKDRGQLYKFLASRQMKEKDNETFLSNINKIRSVANPLPSKVLTGELSTQTEVSWMGKFLTNINNQNYLDYHNCFKQQFQQISQKFSEQLEDKTKKEARTVIENKKETKQKSQKHLNTNSKPLKSKNKIQSEKQVKQAIQNQNDSKISQNQKCKVNFKVNQKNRQKRKIKNKVIQEETPRIQPVHLSKLLGDNSDNLAQDSKQFIRELKMSSIEAKQLQKDQNSQHGCEKDQQQNKIQQQLQKERPQSSKTHVPTDGTQNYVEINNAQNSQFSSEQYPRKSQIQQQLKQQLLSFGQEQNQQPNILYQKQQKKGQGKNYESHKQSKTQEKQIKRKNSKLKVPIKSDKNQIIYEQQEQNEQQQNKNGLNFQDLKQTKQKEASIIKQQSYVGQARFSLKPHQNVTYQFQNQNKKRSNTQDKFSVREEKIQKSPNISQPKDKSFHQYQNGNLPYINSNSYAHTKHQSLYEQNFKLNRKLKKFNKQNIKCLSLNKSTHQNNAKNRNFQKTQHSSNPRFINQSKQDESRDNKKIKMIKDKINQFLSKNQVQKQLLLQNQKQLIEILEKIKRGLNGREYDPEFTVLMKKYSKQVRQCIHMVQLMHQKSCGKKCQHLQRFYSFVKTLKITGKQQLKISTYIIGDNFEP